MHFGTFAEFNTRVGKTQTQTLRESLAEVDAAENVGMDSVWLAEDHFSPENTIMGSPFTIAGAVAARTSRVRIGMGGGCCPSTIRSGWQRRRPPSTS